MFHSSTIHEVLTVVFQVGGLNQSSAHLQVLLWQRARQPHLGAWSLPGGVLHYDEDVTRSARRQLAEKVDVCDIAHLEQLGLFSDPGRVPGQRVIASSFLGLVPSSVTPLLPQDTQWHSVDCLPTMAFDHAQMIRDAHTRLMAKMSYTNIGFALAPQEFTLSTLRNIYSAVLGYPVDTTNLQRILVRRGVIAQTPITTQSGRFGGRPARLYRFVDNHLRITDEFAALRPPTHEDKKSSTLSSGEKSSSKTRR